MKEELLAIAMITAQIGIWISIFGLLITLNMSNDLLTIKFLLYILVLEGIKEKLFKFKKGGD